MHKNYNDEKFTNVINSLKKLPIISAPNDFDTNLKRKINTFEPLPLPKRERYYEYSRSLVPAFGLVAAIFLIFLIISNQNSSEFENPFLKPPVPRSVTETKQAGDEQKNEIKISENDVVIEEQPVIIYQPSTNTKRSSTSSENLAEKKSNRFIDLISSTTEENNVDKSLREKPSTDMENYNAPSTVNFNGFNISQDEEQVMDKLRARMDSLKKLTKEKNK